MKIIWIICLLSVMVPVQPADAEFYRYTDQHGNVIYTDDLSNVPVGQRTEAEVVDDRNVAPPGYEREIKSPNQAAVPNEAAIDLEGEQEQLETLKSNLKEEFKYLAEENARLKEAQKTAVTPNQVKSFNKQVVSFNTRFQAYKEKEAAYQSRLKQYNKRLNAVTSNPDN